MEESRKSNLFGNVALILFLLVQVGDGVLTYLNVSINGYFEGNPILDWLMRNWGHGVSLIAVKSFASASGIVLHILEVHGVIFSFVVLYTCAAIIPWCFVLFG